MAIWTRRSSAGLGGPSNALSLVNVLLACTPPAGDAGQDPLATSPSRVPEFWQSSGPHTQVLPPGQFHEVRRLQFTGERVLIETWLSLDECRTALARVQDKGLVSHRIPGQSVDLKLTSREVSLLVPEAPEALLDRFPEARSAWQGKLPWTEERDRVVSLAFRAAPGPGAEGPSSEAGLLCPKGSADAASASGWDCYWTGKDADLVSCGKGALDVTPADAPK